MKINVRVNMAGKKEVFDPVRKKYVVLTPEEEVRQYFIAFLQEQCLVPLGSISVERDLKLYKRSFRTDIKVYNKKGQGVMLVECKRPSVKLDDTVKVQISKYHLAGKERYLVITNGMEFLAWEVEEKKEGEEGQKTKALEKIPVWEELNNGN
ncbi:MAG: type I restriction enzyme HsdR N-terminal domain-containing protein [Bacteroidales bacterium]